MVQDARVEGEVTITSWEGNHDQGCDPIHPYLLDECVYSMSVFHLPIRLIKDIEAMIRKFWSGNQDNARKMQ